MSMGGVTTEWSDTAAMEADTSSRRAKVGLYVLIGAISSLFFLLTVAFLVRSQYGDWEHLSAPWQPLAQPGQLWVNTIMLLLASAALQWARVASARNKSRSTFEGLLLAGFLSLCFVAGQLWVWQQMVAAGYFASANPANGFFYLLTGLHGAHLLGGLVALGRTMLKRRKRSMQQTARAVSLCSVYWHYLLALWLLLMLLLTASPEAFAAFAALCGF